MADRSPLRILYIALRDSGSCRSRRIGLEKLGHHVEIVNFFDRVKIPHSLAASIYARTLCGPAVSSFNHAILRRAKEKHYHWAWVDKGTMVFPRVIRALKSMGLFTIHHMTDDFFNPRRHAYFRNMKRAILDYHVHLTSNMYNVRELREMGAPHATQTHLGFDPEFMWPEGRVPAGRDRYRTDVTFVGFWRPHIDDYLVLLLEEGVDFRSWGARFARSPFRRRYGDRCVSGMVTDEYPWIYASAKIGLCFLNRDNRNTSTMRSFEIPASGTFMLGERTEEHIQFFEEGKEAEFFDSPREMLEKIRYYLTHDEERERIAKAGYERCLKSDYSFAGRIRRDLEKITPIYEEFLDDSRK